MLMLQKPMARTVIRLVASEERPLPCRNFFNKKPATGAIVAAHLLDKSGRDFLKTF
jgi:hypothetical protein